MKKINKRNDGQKVTQFSKEEFIQIGEIAKPFWEKGISEIPPKFIVFMGGVGSGKTTMRRQQFANGYVHFDFGEIYNSIKKEFGEDNPKLSSYAGLASDMILRESIDGKKNIVIEIIGENKEIIETIINKMKDIGYKISGQFINCDPVEAYKRHINAVKEDKDYMSSCFTQDATMSFFYQLLELGEMPDSSKE